MANAQCARTREVVKVLKMLVADLKELPLVGLAELDPRLAVAFEVALFGEDAELNADQAGVLAGLRIRAQLREDIANANAGGLSFRARLPEYAQPKR